MLSSCHILSYTTILSYTIILSYYYPRTSDSVLHRRKHIIICIIGFPENDTSMVRRLFHDLEPVNHLENLGHIDHCSCFPRTQSQRISVEGEILTIPPTQLLHAVVSCFTPFADRRSPRAPRHTQPRVEATRDAFKWVRDWIKAIGSGLFELI